MLLSVIAITMITFMIAISMIIPTTAQNPLYDKYKGILSEWHKARICMPCHINTLPESQLNKFLTCSPCHGKGVDISNPEFVENLHGVDVCIKCHVGSEYSRKNLGVRVHVPHVKLDCVICHGKPVTLPDARLCTDCHKGGVHGVHGRVLDDICISCHSENIKDYIPEIKEIGGVKLKVGVNESAQSKVKGVFSIGELIISLIKLIFG